MGIIEQGTLDQLERYAVITDGIVVNVVVFDAPPDKEAVQAIGCDQLVHIGDEMIETSKISITKEATI